MKKCVNVRYKLWHLHLKMGNRYKHVHVTWSNRRACLESIPMPTRQRQRRPILRDVMPTSYHVITGTCFRLDKSADRLINRPVQYNYRRGCFLSVLTWKLLQLRRGSKLGCRKLHFCDKRL